MYLEELSRYFNNGDSKIFLQVLICLPVCTLCSLIVGWVYRKTHQSISYSKSYVQTLVLTSLVVALVMLVIGTNIARAFTLVGALSIIRFRNAIKETRDVGYIFFSMAVAMACGTQFYGVAVVGTLFISMILLILNSLNYGESKVEAERVLRLRIPDSLDVDEVIVPCLRSLVSKYSLILTENGPQNNLVDMMFSVVPNKDISANKIVSALTALDERVQVTFNYELHTDDL